MSRKIVSSFSAELPYLHLADYFAKKLKIGKGAFIRLAIAQFAKRFMTVRELDMNPSVRASYLEVTEKELYQTHYKDLKDEVDKQDAKIISEGGLYGKREDTRKVKKGAL